LFKKGNTFLPVAAIGNDRIGRVVVEEHFPGVTDQFVIVCNKNGDLFQRI
jgi:hypothetical protein